MDDLGPHPPARKAFLVSWLLVWCALCAFTWHYGLNLCLRIWAARDGIAAGYRSALLVSWKTPFLAFCLVLCGLLARRLVRAAARRGIRPPGAAAALAAAAALSLCGLVGYDLLSVNPEQSRWWSRNRWGFFRVWPPSVARDSDPRNGEVPVLHVATNSQSFRDDEWAVPAPKDQVRRVLLAGDSVVFSLSIADKADLLDSLLERRLGAAGPVRWDVWNLASAPASLWYFCEVVMRAAPDALPRYAVLVVNAGSDLSFMDEQKALADKPAWFYPLSRQLGLYDDLLRAGANPWPVRPRPEEAASRWQLAQFERFLDFCASRGIRVVVWDASGPSRWFDPYRARPGVVFLSWRTSVGLSCGESPNGECLFYRDPAYGFPSTHLTPKGNALVAEAIAGALLELERRGAADPSGRPAPKP